MITKPSSVCLTSSRVPELRKDDVLITSSYSLISSGTERVAFSGQFEIPSHWSDWISYPFNPGYGLVGNITAVGSNVTRLSVGDRVVTRRPHASKVVVPMNSVMMLPSSVANLDACWFALSAIAQQAIRRSGPIFGQTVLVVGLGPLGQLVARYAALAGAAAVIVVSRDNRRLELATTGQAGAYGLKGTLGEAVEPIRELTAGQGVTTAFDVTGDPEVLKLLPSVTAIEGLVVMVGDTAWPSRQTLSGLVLRNSQTLVGVHAARSLVELLLTVRRISQRMWTFFS